MTRVSIFNTALGVPVLAGLPAFQAAEAAAETAVAAAAAAVATASGTMLVDMFIV